MKTYLLKSALFVLIISLLQSCIFIGSGGSSGIIAPQNLTDKTFSFKDFDGLDMSNAFVVNVTRSNNFSVVARGDMTDLADLDIYVNRDGDLVARYRNWRIKRYQMDINITMPDLVFTNFSGATNARIDGFNNLKSLETNVSGASKVIFTGNINKLNFDISGASTVELRGNGASMIGQLSGASHLETVEFLVDDADINLSGASSARVNVKKTLRISASGASSVRYRGNPDIRQNLSGSSSVKAD